MVALLVGLLVGCADERADSLDLASGDIGCEVLYDEETWLIGPIPVSGGITIEPNDAVSIRVGTTSSNEIVAGVDDPEGRSESWAPLASISPSESLIVGLDGARLYRVRCWIED